MKPFRTLQIVVAFIAAFPLLNPVWMHPVLANDLLPVGSPVPRELVHPEESRPVDVVLEAGNLLTGRVVTSLEVPLANSELVITQGRQEIARVLTSQRGGFQVRLPKGGVYMLSTARSVSVIRTWTAVAAPPTALNSVTLVERLVIRGQEQDCGCANPAECKCEPKRTRGKAVMLTAICGALACAIAIPLILIISDDDDDETPTSP